MLTSVGIIAEAGTMNQSARMNWNLYAYAALVVLAAYALRFSLIPLVGPGRLPFITFFPAVVFCAWRIGVGPAVLAVLLSLVATWPEFSPFRTLDLDTPVLQVSAFAAFTIASGFIIALGEANRRARDSLEQRVLERTAELSHHKDALQALSARLMHLSDDDRRRVARELHDGVGQLLAGIAMNTAALIKSNLPPQAVEKLLDTETLTREAIRQIRTTSHLLHPPLLDELGLSSALEWYVDGFSKRSGIPVTLKIPKDLNRLPPNTEIAIFRVVQECLTNIHRHANASSGSVELSRLPGNLQLAIRDDGTGMPDDYWSRPNGRSGVGLRGIKERIEELGGQLRVGSSQYGTEIIARIPLPNDEAIRRKE